jgi:hypothetical protein
MQQQQRCADDFLHGLHLRVASMERDIEQIKAAFPKNDLGATDFDGHRGYHLRKITEGQVMGEYKQEVTKKIVLGVIGLIFTVLGFIAGPAVLRWLH